MSIKRIVSALMCLSVIFLSVSAVKNQPETLEYLFLSPKVKETVRTDDSGNEQEDSKKEEKSMLKEIVEKLQRHEENWKGIMTRWTLSSENEHVSIQGNNTQRQAHLTGILDMQPVLPPRLIRFGRDFYPEELEKGEKVMLLDENLALDLFRVGDPVGRTAAIGGTEFRVIGIVRHHRTVGESEAFSAYVPLKALDEMWFQTQVLKVSAVPVPSAGAQAAFLKDMTRLFPGGSMYNLSNEQYLSLLPVRCLLVFSGVLLLSRGFKQAKKLQNWMIQDYRQRLTGKYCWQLMHRSVGYVLAGICLYSVLLLGCFFVLTIALDPVYVFPQWVPAVPVEWTEISKTFWNNRTAETAMIEIRSPAVHTYRFYRNILTLACVWAGGLILTWKYQYQLKKLKNGK